MAAFLVQPAGGGTALLASILVSAGSSKSKEAVLTVATVVGYILSSFLLLAPLYKFVKPNKKEKGVGARTTYGHIWTMFGCTVWTLYAMPSFKKNFWTVIINGAGSLLNLGYTGGFLYFALKEARRSPLYLLLGTLTISVIASIVTGIGCIFVFHDLMDVLESRRASSNLIPLLEVLFNLSNASIWAFCAFFSKPVDFYSGIPCAVGGLLLLAKLAAYILYRTDDDDFGFELRALFESPV